MSTDATANFSDQKGHEFTTCNYRGEETTITYRNGEKTGFKYYYRTGQLHIEEKYKNNKKDECLQYYENGRLCLKEHYKNGILNGKYERWYEDGKKSLECNHVAGKLHGKRLCYYKNGTLESEDYFENGILEGKYREWYRDGQLQKEYNYVAGKLDGECLLYHMNGKLRANIFYKNNIRKGKYQSWYESGQKYAECYYIDDYTIGEHKIWNSDGVLKYHCDGKKILTLLDDKDRNCALPDGEFVCWKACKTTEGKNVYVKLLVPAEAKRVTVKSSSYKGRVEHASVVQIVDSEGNEYNEAYSFVHTIQKGFRYEVGKTVIPDKYDDDYRTDCSHGINVFLYEDMCEQYFSL